MEEATMSDRDNNQIPLHAVAIIALFITALVTAQVTATKVLAFDLPISLPIIEDTMVLPGASLAIAVMFFASDCYTELFGRRAAHIVINVGFVMNFFLLALVWSTIIAPAAPGSVDPGEFETVLGASTNIVLGSLVAYLVSQNWDVFVFHWIRERTDGAHLWLRNIASTATSQAIDTVIFVTIAFSVAPNLLGLGSTIPTDVLVALILGQYLLKLAIAILDTPFVYLVVYLARGKSVRDRLVEYPLISGR